MRSDGCRTPDPHPGNSLARRFDGGHAELTAGMKREAERQPEAGDLLAPSPRRVRAGVRGGDIGELFWVRGRGATVLCLYPLIALGDPRAWRKFTES